MAGLASEPAGGVFSAGSNAAFKKQLNKVYGWYTGGFLVFVVVLAILEQLGLPKAWIGYIFLFATVLLYAGIGIMSRTNDAAEYYVAGRRVPAIYNGMATGADWMSAASFIGMAGTLYLTGYGGLAFIMGWTGGYCLVALFLAPYLRKFGQFTIPDFLGARYEGNIARFVGIIIAIFVSFVYVVAQIYGVGLITTRLTGVDFSIGIFLGLAGILVCSFLGGMRAVTWTQVAQYIVLIIAYMIPVVWLSVRQTGVPVPQLVYGYQLQKVTEAEQRLIDDPKEKEVIAAFKAQADALAEKLKDVPAALAAERAAAEQKVAELRAANAPADQIAAAEKALASLPKDEAAAKEAWTKAKAAAEARAKPLAGMPRHAQQFAGDPNGDEKARKTFEESRRNFLALVFCLMVGTAALPHILMRYYTTPSVKEARQSVGWSLFFIFLLYFTAPALAVLVKYEVFSVLVGTPFDKLPAWIANWSKVDPGLLSVTDVNKDGIFQLGEMRIGGDIIVLATPEIAGLPYVISGMVAAGGLAAALSTADGLLLTIANALSHDLYYKMMDPNAPTARRVMISKVLLLVVALLAAYVASQKPADILFLVSAAFSLAAAGFFPALTLGIFWKRATKWGAILGMIAGFGVTFYYMATTQPWLRSVFGVTSPVADNMWWGIQPISAGIFGVPVGFAVIIIVSLLTPAPKREIQELVEHVRYPNLAKA
ncbi:cation acetate symporter [Tepidimonas taiwanensis]|uniref:Cation/acetate symporter ActP n=1 Tax=Tepidimonas taiwanensis TaxID=307486 RepID=A0A554X5H7_9BURK|nr:sodium:solute symporter family protein [Tepidimonas taiwanensis]MCX7693889.1 cation acetate symporter [Tepidimonas taiwanensis]MDM7463861.1 sodium:solute symporter family protein [Tepidimonas taiwanensis]TSE31090.1 Cation/acetate symporter ActP [Tepidimonas taiwanensis]UBQ05251.1 cation acetate symporter [Tepidimonas taiwanensis]